MTLNEKQHDKRVDVFYRFVQPIFTTITSMGVVALLAMVVSNDKQQAVTQVSMQTMQKQLDKIEIKVDENYTEDEAEADFKLRDQSIERLEARVKRIEDEL